VESAGSDHLTACPALRFCGPNVQSRAFVVAAYRSAHEVAVQTVGLTPL
jgi:hypothetical protein